MAPISDPFTARPLSASGGSHLGQQGLRSWLGTQVGDELIVLPHDALRSVDTCPLAPPPSWSAAWIGALALHGEVPLLVVCLDGAQTSPAPGAQGLVAIMGDGSWGVGIDRISGFCTADAAVERHRHLPAAWPCPISFLAPVTMSDGRAAWSLDVDAVALRLASAL